MTSKVVAWQEHTWLDLATERRMWKQLIRAYQFDFDMLSPDAFFPHQDLPVVVVDEEGVEELEDFQHPIYATYVFGRTGQSLMCLPHEASVRITYPGHHSLFGMQAAAIVLSDWYHKL